MRKSVLLLSLLLVILVSLTITVQDTFALFEHDVGKKDWMKENIGRVNRVLFPTGDSSSSSKQRTIPKLVLATTTENVLAAIGLRTGAIAWRRVFHNTDLIDELKRVSDEQVITFSQGCKFIRLWDSTGLQQWQIVNDGSKHHLCDAIPLNINEQQHAILLTSNRVQAVNVKTGSITWKYESQMNNILFTALMSDNKGLHIAAVNYDGTHILNSVALITLDPKTGSVKTIVSSDTFEAPVSCSRMSDCVRVVKNTVFILSQDGIIANDLGSMPFISKSLKDLNIDLKSPIIARNNYNLVIQDTSDNTAYKILSSSGEMKLDKVYKAGLSLSEPAILSGISYHAELTQQKDETRVVVFDTTSGKNVHEFSFSRPQIQHGYLMSAHLHAFKNEDNSIGFRVLVVSEDDSLTVAKKDRQVWTREEGLATVESSQFVNLPRKLGFKPRTSENTYVNRIQNQVEQLKNIVPRLSLFISSLINPATATNVTEADLLFEDHFGFNKLILVRTRAGKLFALHTSTGEVVWSIFPRALIQNRSTGNEIKTQFYVIRQQEAGEETSVVPEIAVLMAEGGVSTIVRLNGLLGTVISAEELAATFKSAIVLPITEKLTLYHPLLIVDTDMNVHVYPDKTRMRSTLAKFNQNIHFYTSDLVSSTLTGYTWSPSSQNPKAIPVWSSKFEGRITSISPNTSPQNEHIYSSVFIAGKSMLHKYLNPNLIVVSSLVEDNGESTLHLYLVDSVTGRRVHHTIFENAKEPINTLIDDNVVLCQYMNTKPRRPQISVFELFINDTSAHDVSVIHSIANRFTSGKQQVISSHDLSSPILLHSTFVLPYAARTIAPTKTSIGVTSKEFLLGLTNDQILEINKKTVDVRRPRGGPMPQDEEGLMPYNPYIPYSPLSILTYNQTVHNVRGIQTEPSLLESTTHVWAYGLDLFYRRIAPSKPFDSLEEGFSHSLLLLTITVLIVITYFSKAYSQKKALTQLWS